VSAVWGVTNPLLKAGNESTVAVSPSGRGRAWDAARQVAATLANWRFSVPFAVNQAGSVLNVALLGSVDMSMAVPIINALTFVWTAVASAALGETGALTPRTAAGAALILAGVAVCVHAKAAEEGGGGGVGGPGSRAR
jgi:hypothetical protein